MKKNDVTIFTQKEVWGDAEKYGQSPIFQKIGTKCRVTDFCLLLGALVEKTKGLKVNTDQNGKIIHNGLCWTQSNKDGEVVVIGRNGEKKSVNSNEFCVSIRPIIRNVDLKFNQSNVLQKIDDNLYKVQYGEYPQFAISQEDLLYKDLENAYKKNDSNLKRTGKIYEISPMEQIKYFCKHSPNKEKVEKYTKNNYALQLHELIYKNKKYIRFVPMDVLFFIKGQDFSKNQILSKSSIVGGKENNFMFWSIWVQVEPLNWWYDKFNNVMLCENAVCSGISMSREKNFSGEFENTEIYKFLNNKFISNISINKNSFEQKNVHKNKDDIKIANNQNNQITQKINQGEYKMMIKNEISLPKVNEIILEKGLFYRNNKNSFFPIDCVPTDFALVLGAQRENYNFVNHNKKGKGAYWTQSTKATNSIIINEESEKKLVDKQLFRVGIRPIIRDLKEDDVKPYRSFIYPNNVWEIRYGEYPQKAIEKKLQDELEKQLQLNLLIQTGKSYTVGSMRELEKLYGSYDSLNSTNSHKHFLTFKEYAISQQGNVRKFIRVGLGNLHFTNCDFSCKDFIKLSNGEQVRYSKHNYIWIEVSPIVWFYDVNRKAMISKQSLASGIKLYNGKDLKNERQFKNTEMYTFLNGSFQQSLEQSFVMPKQIMEYEKRIDYYNKPNKIEIKDILDTQSSDYFESIDDVRFVNPYNFNYDKVSEEEIIKGAIKSNIPVFLHGKSSEGKSARVKQFDSDCEIIYLRNATPESLNGKSVYNSQTNEMIDLMPTWLKRLNEKCEKEKDKLHILFFDELTNALPSIQGMAFNIVLDKEVNGIWKLPKNCRIVAAGNDVKDSLSAHDMSEPMFNRFAHVYIRTTSQSWLQWASTPKDTYERLECEEKIEEAKIHPAIYAYIAYKAYGKQDVLRTEYTGETPNADPRKWEMASKVLYANNNPQMLRALIGEELTADFVEFTKQKIITVDDVLSGNYTDDYLKMNISQKFATAVGLSSVSEDSFEKVREFTKKLGPEICATFESVWAGGNDERLTLIAELKLQEKMQNDEKNNNSEVGNDLERYL